MRKIPLLLLRCLELLLSFFGIPIAPPEDNQKIEESCAAADLSNYGIELPFDVIIEILVRLPVGSLLRCKSVCKLWCAQIQETEFIKRHMRSRNIIYVYEENGGKDLRTFHRFDILDGLLVEKNRLTKIYRIWNPATKQMLQLPGPYKLVEHMRLCYLPTTNNYKLVRVYGKEGKSNGGCQVLDFGTDLRWRYIDIPSFHNLASVGDMLDSKTINQVFFVSRFFPAGYGDSCIFFLEIESERSGIIKIPEAFFTNWTNVMPLIWEKTKLALADLVVSELHFWILEDYWNGKWAVRKIVLPLTFWDIVPQVPQELRLQHLYKGVLCLQFGYGNLIWYNSKSKKVSIISPPPGKRLLYGFIPSLVSLREFRPQD